MATVLIVDDDPFITRLVRVKVEQLGHTVETAGDGEEGLRKAMEIHPDLILLDLMMPRMNGLEMCRRLRAQPGGRAVPIVMLTARAQERDLEAGFAAGANDYLVKPFSPRELQARLRSLLDRSTQVPDREVSAVWELHP
ncbi:MAG: response regulator transcription factor [Ktedonobacterales bacterium]